MDQQSDKEKDIAMTSYQARITGPIAYRGKRGREHHIPIGPCLLEGMDSGVIVIVWGANAQRSITLPLENIEAAQRQGLLILIESTDD